MTLISLLYSTCGGRNGHGASFTRTRSSGSSIKSSCSIRVLLIAAVVVVVVVVSDDCLIILYHVYELGNKAISSKDYLKAVDLYSQAIEACPDGRNSHIYFCNRAAAFTCLKKYDQGNGNKQPKIRMEAKNQGMYAFL